MPRLDDASGPDARPPQAGSAWLRRMRSRRPIETVLVLVLALLAACVAVGARVLVSLPVPAAPSSPVGPAVPHPGAGR